jgi:hypothetical protein
MRSTKRIQVGTTFARDMADDELADNPEDGYEPFEVYTGDQARRVLGVAEVRSVTQRADTVKARQKVVVCWRKEDPGNTTQVNLFLASWVDDVAAREGGPAQKLTPNLMCLARLPGMTAPAATYRPVGPSSGEESYRSHEQELVADGYRREATIEREARLEAERDRYKDRCEALQAQLDEVAATKRALAKSLVALSTELAAG